MADYDLIIVGGGMVGVSLALALADQPLKIALIDAKEYSPAQTKNQKDKRTIALSYTSQKIFEGLGLWDSLAQFATPIEHIHISDKGHLGLMRLHAQDHQLNSFGYVVEAFELVNLLYKNLFKADNIDYLSPCTVIDSVMDNNQRSVTVLDNNKIEKKLTTNLLIAADGTNSPLREKFNIKTKQKNYNQLAMIANIGLSKSHNNTAYERFSPDGPIAFLPMKDNQAGLAWAIPMEDKVHWESMAEEDFLKVLIKKFGYRLGRFTWCGPKYFYPLELLYAETSIAERGVLIGNASHTLHPIAAQGLNLGLRDVSVLAELIVSEYSKSKDIGHSELLNTYQQSRLGDQRRTIYFTDGVTKLFFNQLLPITVLRNIGLMGLDIFPSLNKHFATRATGMNGKQALLNLGLPLSEGDYD